MNKTFTRLKYIFLGLFLLGSAGVLAYHGLWVWPKERCEARGGDEEVEDVVHGRGR